LKKNNWYLVLKIFTKMKLGFLIELSFFNYV